MYGPAIAAQAPGGQPAYVVRGKQTEARQRTLKERIERFHDALAAALGRDAPELLPGLEPPPPGVSGYQILPRIVPDAPPGPLARPQVVSYSWRWSDTLIARETVSLERLEAELARILASGVDRAAYAALAADYRKAVDRRRPIDADVDYNWLWQAAIAGDRPRFDRINRRLEAVVERQAIEDALAARDDDGRRAVAGITGVDLTLGGVTLRDALAVRAGALTREIAAGMGGVAPPGFARIEHPAGHEWRVVVPLYTDITDAAFVEAFTAAVESAWHVRAGQDEFRVQLEVEVLTPERLYCRQAGGTGAGAAGCAPPAPGAAIDLAAHVARFPAGGAVLTTGATTLKLSGDRALVVGPHDAAPRVLAHEFGHLLGFPDAYFRGYGDLGADGFQVRELVPDAADIMASPGTGSVLARHFEALIAARNVQATMAAGLDALYQRDDPVEAVARFRAVLALSPAHYGATLQLAKALDRAGQAGEAVAWWTKILAMAEAASDAGTARTARERLVHPN